VRGANKLATFMCQLCDAQSSWSTKGLSRTVQGFLSVVMMPKHVVLNNYKSGGRVAESRKHTRYLNSIYFSDKIHRYVTKHYTAVCEG
jgi:hypothetical protein